MFPQGEGGWERDNNKLLKIIHIIIIMPNTTFTEQHKSEEIS